MRRAATQTAKTVFEGVFGKGPDRVEKIYQLGQAVVEGATKATTTKGAQVANYSRRSFEDIAPPSFDIRNVENTMTSRMSSHDHDSDENKNPNYKTPKKPTSSPTEPKLALRQRQSQTPSTRAKRLGLIVAPTVGQPTPLATRLSFDDDYE